MTHHQEYLITLIVPVSLEETVVDFLLLQEPEHGFCTYPVNSHHHRHQGLTLVEQVSGRQKRLCFQVQVDTALLPHFTNSLKTELAGSSIRYWIAPLLETGKV